MLNVHQKTCFGIYLSNSMNRTEANLSRPKMKAPLLVIHFWTNQKRIQFDSKKKTKSTQLTYFNIFFVKNRFDSDALFSKTDPSREVPVHQVTITINRCNRTRNPYVGLSSTASHGESEGLGRQQQAKTSGQSAEPLIRDRGEHTRNSYVSGL